MRDSNPHRRKPGSFQDCCNTIMRILRECAWFASRRQNSDIFHIFARQNSYTPKVFPCWRYISLYFAFPFRYWIPGYKLNPRVILRCQKLSLWFLLIKCVAIIRRISPDSGEIEASIESWRRELIHHFVISIMSQIWHVPDMRYYWRALIHHSQALFQMISLILLQVVFAIAPKTKNIQSKAIPQSVDLLNC